MSAGLSLPEIFPGALIHRADAGPWISSRLAHSPSERLDSVRDHKVNRSAPLNRASNNRTEPGPPFFVKWCLACVREGDLRGTAFSRRPKAIFIKTRRGRPRTSGHARGPHKNSRVIYYVNWRPRQTQIYAKSQDVIE